MGDGIDAADFNCICAGTGFVVMVRGNKSEEAKCPQCDHWRHQDWKSDHIKSLPDMERLGWKLID